VRPGDLKTTDSGQAARLVRSRWEELVEAGTLDAGNADTTAVSVTFRWTAIATTVVLLAASYWGVAVP
jgi:hypothetical protein